ncbi:hypothetical protein Pryu01_01256 [Paraliobacillus ryukyuensis]|uniref:YopX protein domain-containing protein n=1 Tax=Paraliobacillus ryukyuensis TaxID=200904 RepID=A0A366EAQ6_9BACI|nr:hypothetical protein [Paraliobacillus ryukyuensis]RBO99510.1 hypothetical protein DES48_104186 [Paraliobacillus ryukyuensis]
MVNQQRDYLIDKDKYGNDFFGNEVFCGDEIYIYEEEFWLVDSLSGNEKTLLDLINAKKIRATNTNL